MTKSLLNGHQFPNRSTSCTQEIIEYKLINLHSLILWSPSVSSLFESEVQLCNFP